MKSCIYIMCSLMKVNRPICKNEITKQFQEELTIQSPNQTTKQAPGLFLWRRWCFPGSCGASHRQHLGLQSRLTENPQGDYRTGGPNFPVWFLCDKFHPSFPVSRMSSIVKSSCFYCCFTCFHSSGAQGPNCNNARLCLLLRLRLRLTKTQGKLGEVSKNMSENDSCLQKPIEKCIKGYQGISFQCVGPQNMNQIHEAKMFSLKSHWDYMGWWPASGCGFGSWPSDLGSRINARRIFFGGPA